MASTKFSNIDFTNLVRRGVDIIPESKTFNFYMNLIYIFNTKVVFNFKQSLNAANISLSSIICSNCLEVVYIYNTY